ncbi:DUF2278 family protein [Scytonema sp. NUACC21]
MYSLLTHGVFQDGGLFVHFRDRNEWVAALFAFQSQSFHTNDDNGDPLDVRVGTDQPCLHNQPPQRIFGLLTQE